MVGRSVFTSIPSPSFLARHTDEKTRLKVQASGERAQKDLQVIRHQEKLARLHEDYRGKIRHLKSSYEARAKAKEILHQAAIKRLEKEIRQHQLDVSGRLMVLILLVVMVVVGPP